MNNLTEVWEKEIRPPISPDCIPFDYFGGGVSELRVRSNPQKKTRDLIPYTCEVMVPRQATVAKACKSFRSMFDAVVTTDGYFNE
jgi:hypothetical protein